MLVDSSSDNITITLPYAGNVTGRQYQIKKISTSNSVWISGGGNLIDDTSPIELPESSDLASVKLISDGSQWYKIEQKDILETVAADNLVGWWKLDETSGDNATDSSGYHNHGNATNMAAGNIGVDGKIIRAYDFDGVDDYISLNSGKLPNLANGSVSLWAKFDVSNDNQYVIDFPTPRIVILEDAVGTNQLKLHVAGGDAITGTGLLTADVWYFICGTWNDSTNVKNLYVNNVLKATASTAFNTSATPSGGFKIGSSNAGVSGFTDGLIDDVRVYNKVLSLAEIQALYNQGQ
jgi:hypothetical protein